MNVSVIGLGKAGLPLAAVIADAGIKVMGVDIDKQKAASINAGKNPLPEEPGLGALIRKHGGQNLKATIDGVMAARLCKHHIIIVPLFIDEKKQPDFSLIKKALAILGKGLKKKDTVIIETTMPIGTTETLIKSNLERESGLRAGKDFYLAYSPERIMTGYSISRYREFPKLIAGIDAASTEKAFSLYRAFSNPIKVSNARTAEFAKVAEGIYRDVNIALANELYKITESHDIDFWEMREAAKHEYCNILEPGNVGGHCIPVYPWFVINAHEVPLIKTARMVNDAMAEYYVNKIKLLKPKKVGIIGLSYREGVREKAYARSIAVIKLLKEEGYDVYGLDPLYSKDEIKNNFSIKYLGDFKKMDAIMLLNKEQRYRKLLMPIKDRVIDVKGVLRSK